MSGEPNAPFSPPDCPWVRIGNEVPKNVAKGFGKLKGEEVHIGRVYENGVYYIGTALPKQGVCKYLNQAGELKQASNYEILTIDCGNPLEFRTMDFDSNLQFVSGADGDNIYYTSRVVEEGGATYIGWVSRDDKICHIPRESSNKLDDCFEVMVHKFLDRLCICPCPPPQCL